MRRTLSVATVALLLGACGRTAGGDGGGDITYPTGAREVVLRVEIGGGLIQPSAQAAELPGFSLYGDGTLITMGPQIEIYPPPALPPLMQQSVSPEGIRTLLGEAEKAGLFADRQYTALSSTIMDAGTTTFTVAANDTTYTTSVYALGLDQGPVPGDTEAEREARTKIQAFNNKLFDLSWLPKDSVSPATDYEPQAMRVYRYPYRNEDPELPQMPVKWPLAKPLESAASDYDAPEAKCILATGKELGELLRLARHANTLTPWVSGGEQFRLVFRPLLPDESGCYVSRTTVPIT